MLPRLVFCFALVISLFLAGPAAARDRDRDRLPDRWEARYGISTKAKSASKDPDRDGLTNLSELRMRTSPRDRDTDDDGIGDSREVAGTVESFEDGVLTIELLDGREVSGRVTDATEVECEDGDRDDDDGDRDEDNSGPGNARDRGEDDDDRCPASVLVAGARVHEAELDLTAAGAVFDEVEILQ